MAVSVPSFFAPIFIFARIPWPMRVLIMSSLRVATHFTGRPGTKLAMKAMVCSTVMSDLYPKHPPSSGMCTRTSEAGCHFHIADVNAANDAVRTIQARGGRLVEFTPIKESLEDLFVRKQEPAS